MIKRLAFIAAILLVSCLGTIWLLFQHKPAWYRPLEIPREQAQAIRDDFVGTVDHVSEKMNTSGVNKVFEIKLTQDQINAWLAAREQIYPALRQWTPVWLNDPYIILEQDGFRVAATAFQKGIKCVVSVNVRAHIQTDGIAIQLTHVAGGSLPMPKSVIEGVITRLERHFRTTTAFSEDNPRHEVFPTLAELFKGTTIPKQWVWKNGDQPFLIQKIQFEPGAVTFAMQPLARHNKQNPTKPKKPDPFFDLSGRQ